VESYAEVHGKLVLGPTKTYQRRTVRLPRFLADLLGEHQAVTGPAGLAFRDSQGGPLRHSNFYRRRFKPAVESAAVKGTIPKGLRFHDLRHTCVALLVAQGAHPMAIKERLGHSSITVTLDQYGHLMPSIDETLAEGLVPRSC
jgi:integrase